MYKNKKLLATLRARDYVILPHAIASDIHSKTKKWRVVVDKEAVPFVKQGKNVFAKFVRDCDSDIRSGMEILVVDEKDNLLGSGRAKMCAREMIDFRRGLAVSVRKT